MPSNRVEHFCTLFDSNFLPQGLALHASLQRHAPEHVLWILCMDEAVERSLRTLALPGVRLIPLRDLETPELLSVKPGRSRAEYCWTLTCFLPSAVFARDPSAPRVTYVEADLFFFASPRTLLDELDASGGHVLITEHGFDPRYAYAERNGRFCVQFVTFRNTQQGREVLAWWQERCLEWCFARHEDGKFGDQKYLDLWPSMFGETVHVLSQRPAALGPWNVAMHSRTGGWIERVVFYHFHGLRIFRGGTTQLYFHYEIPRQVQRLIYAPYLDALRTSLRVIQSRDLAFDPPVLDGGFLASLRRRYRALKGALGLARIA